MVKKRKSSRTNVGEGAALCRENSQNAVLNGDPEQEEKAEEEQQLLIALVEMME